MLGETACNKRVEAWAARQFRDVRGAVETHRFDQKNTSGLQKMRAVLLIILEVGWTRLDKI